MLFLNCSGCQHVHQTITLSRHRSASWNTKNLDNFGERKFIGLNIELPPRAKLIQLYRCQQTADVEVCVGSDETSVKMREGVLRRRSPILAAQIDNSQKWSVSGEVRLSDVTWETFQTFWEWSYMKEPQIPASAGLDEVIELGIMASKYHVLGLQHEVSDLLRQKLRHKNWKLGPRQVRRMLSCDEAVEWLRPLVSACLCTIVVPQSSQDKGVVDEWLEVLDDDRRLAWEWKRSDFLRLGAGQITDGGPCRFHEHEWGVTVESTDGMCPYQKAELYPPVEQGKGKRKSKGRRRLQRIVPEVTASVEDVCAEEELVVVEGTV